MGCIGLVFMLTAYRKGKERKGYWQGVKKKDQDAFLIVIVVVWYCIGLRLFLKGCKYRKGGARCAPLRSVGLLVRSEYFISTSYSHGCVALRSKELGDRFLSFFYWQGKENIPLLQYFYWWDTHSPLTLIYMIMALRCWAPICVGLCCMFTPSSSSSVALLTDWLVVLLLLLLCWVRRERCECSRHAGATDVG